MAVKLLAIVALLALVGCRNVTRPGVQVEDTRSVLLETVATTLPVGATEKTTYPHGSRDTKYSAILIVGDYTSDVAKDEEPGSEQLLASWAEGLGNERILTMRVTDVAVTPESRAERVVAAWNALVATKLVDRNRIGMLVQGDAVYTVAPLLKRLRPRVVVFAGCPGRPFADVARDRALEAHAKTDGSMDVGQVLDGVAKWAKGKLPEGAFWTATFGAAPEGYYVGSFDKDLEGYGGSIPALVLFHTDEVEGSSADADALADIFGAKKVAVPLADRFLKAYGRVQLPGPTDPVVPDAVDAVAEFVGPILNPSDLQAN